MAGHHIQCIGSFWKLSSDQYTKYVSSAESPPARTPAIAQNSSPSGETTAGCAGTGNSGPMPIRYLRITAAVALASATGTRLRGFHSKSNNSAASIAAATGDANVA